MPIVSHHTTPQGMLPLRPYAIVPTMPVNRKLQLLIAVARCRSTPRPKARNGASNTPPTPKVPIMVPVINPTIKRSGDILQAIGISEVKSYKTRCSLENKCRAKIEQTALAGAHTFLLLHLSLRRPLRGTRLELAHDLFDQEPVASDDETSSESGPRYNNSGSPNAD